MGVGTLESDVEEMTVDEAVSVPSIRYAISKITSVIAQVPFQLYKMTDDGKTPAKNHQWYFATKHEPNPWTMKFDFMESIVYSAVMFGDARVFVDSETLELWLLPFQSSATVWQDGEKYHIVKVPTKEDPIWKFRSGRESNDTRNLIVFRDEEVIHIKGLSSNGLTGSGVLDCKQTFRIAADSEAVLSNQIGKGFSGSLMLEAPIGVFTKETEGQEFLENFRKNQMGKENAGKPGLLRQGIKANMMQMSNNDAQFIEGRRFNREDVALLFGLEMILGQDKSVSYSTAEQKNSQEVRNCFTRWTKKITQEFARKLLTLKERKGEKYCFDFDFSDYLKPDATSEANRLIALRNAMIITANEARVELGWNTRDDADDLINPAVLAKGEATEENKNDAEDAQDAKDDMKEARGRSAIESVLRNLINVEIDRVVSHAKNPDKFLNWMDLWYESWQVKLADKLEEFGLDRDNARLHCEQSKAALLQCSEASPGEFEQVVKDSTQDWTVRLYQLMGAEHGVAS
jgi:HK97 family phage portal protein